MENFIDEKKKIFFDLEDDFKSLSDKYKQIKLNHEISRTVDKKLEDKIEKSEKSLKELNELFNDISNQKDLTEMELNDIKEEINNNGRSAAPPRSPGPDRHWRYRWKSSLAERRGGPRPRP